MELQPSCQYHHSRMHGKTRLLCVLKWDVKLKRYALMQRVSAYVADVEY